jgi:hypothetical protein
VITVASSSVSARASPGDIGTAISREASRSAFRAAGTDVLEGGGVRGAEVFGVGHDPAGDLTYPWRWGRRQACRGTQREDEAADRLDAAAPASGLELCVKSIGLSAALRDAIEQVGAQDEARVDAGLRQAHARHFDTGHRHSRHSPARTAVHGTKPQLSAGTGSLRAKQRPRSRNGTDMYGMHNVCFGRLDRAGP